MDLVATSHVGINHVVNKITSTHKPPDTFNRSGYMTPKKSKPNPDDKEQYARFIEAAKRIENPDAKEAFEKALQNIIRKKRPPK